MKKSEVPNGVEDKADNDCLTATLTLKKNRYFCLAMKVGFIMPNQHNRERWTKIHLLCFYQTSMLLNLNK